MPKEQCSLFQTLVNFYNSTTFYRTIVDQDICWVHHKLFSCCKFHQKWKKLWGSRPIDHCQKCLIITELITFELFFKKKKRFDRSSRATNLGYSSSNFTVRLLNYWKSIQEIGAQTYKHSFQEVLSPTYSYKRPLYKKKNFSQVWSQTIKNDLKRRQNIKSACRIFWKKFKLGQVKLWDGINL